MLVTFEGIDGSGKSTLKNKFEGEFGSYDNTVFTSEPYSEVETNTIIREFLSDSDSDPIQLLYLYMSNHIAHVESFIRPQLEKNNIIFCDRYYDSMLVYQSTELDEILDKKEESLLDEDTDLLQFFDELQNIGGFQIEPNVTLYIDISSETAIDRIKDSREDIDRFETKNQLQELSEKYEQLYAEKDRIVKIDGEQDIESVYSDCVEVLQNKNVLPI